MTLWERVPLSDVTLTDWRASTDGECSTIGAAPRNALLPGAAAAAARRRRTQHTPATARSARHPAAPPTAPPITSAAPPLPFDDAPDEALEGGWNGRETGDTLVTNSPAEADGLAATSTARIAAALGGGAAAAAAAAEAFAVNAVNKTTIVVGSTSSRRW